MRDRLVAVRLLVQVVRDDGETLHPRPPLTLDVPAADWPRVVEIVAEALAKLQAESDK